MGMNWIFTPRGGGPTKAVRPLCRLKINTAESAIDAAIAGVGVTNVLSYQIARGVSERKLKVVLRDYEPDAIPVHLVYSGHAALPMKMRHFIDFSIARLRKSLSLDLAKLNS